MGRQRRSVVQLGWKVGLMVMVGLSSVHARSAETLPAHRRLLQDGADPDAEAAPKDHPLLDLVPPGMLMTAPAIPPQGPHTPSFDVAPYVHAPPINPPAPKLGVMFPNMKGMKGVDDLLASSESDETAVDSDSSPLLETTKFDDPLDLLTKHESPPPFPSDPIEIISDGNGGFSAADEKMTVQSVSAQDADDTFDDPLGLFNERPPSPGMPLTPGTLVPPSPPSLANSPEPPFIVADDPLGLLASVESNPKPRSWDKRSVPRALILSATAVAVLLALVVASYRSRPKAAAQYQLGLRATETANYGSITSAEEKRKLLDVNPASEAMARL